MRTFVLLFALSLVPAWTQVRSSHVRMDFGAPGESLEIDRMALGQGGLSADSMWDDRLAEVRALHPKVIRLFVQEYFELMPSVGEYNFESLDRSVNLIRDAGAIPLLALTFKPSVLFPTIDQDIVEPNDYQVWKELIYQMVLHYKGQRGGEIYWEVGNEPDIGEAGGCPFRFKADSYVRFYEQTANAVRRADPRATIGGPALASWKSPLLPSLLEHAAAGEVPLDFVSWHIYNSDPLAIRGTIEGVKGLLAKHPHLKPELILNEWNMSLSNPVLDPRFQPAFILETTWHMKDTGLDYSCYYHIRDYHVDHETFARFMSPRGAANMARWWNRMPQFDGLFDYQNAIRPSYFAFKLLSRLRGTRLPLTTNDPQVHGFLTYDDIFEAYYMVLWNFSEDPVRLNVEVDNIPENSIVNRRRLDAMTGSDDENHRLRPMEQLRLEPGMNHLELTLDTYGIQYWEVVSMR